MTTHFSTLLGRHYKFEDTGTVIYKTAGNLPYAVANQIHGHTIDINYVETHEAAIRAARVQNTFRKFDRDEQRKIADLPAAMPWGPAYYRGT